MIRLRVPGSLTYRHLALRVVSAACKMAAPKLAQEEPEHAEGDPDDEFEFETVSAFSEAFNNIAIHGYRPGPPGDVDIEIESDEGGIVIQLIDKGRSFDPSTVRPPDLADLPESGMGLFIMRAFMDEVEYRPGRPNVLRLVKRREAGPRFPDGDGEGEEDGGRRSPTHVEEDAGGGIAGQSGFRRRSVARSSSQRAAEGIKIQ